MLGWFACFSAPQNTNCVYFAEIQWHIQSYTVSIWWNERWCIIKLIADTNMFKLHKHRYSITVDTSCSIAFTVGTFFTEELRLHTDIWDLRVGYQKVRFLIVIQEIISPHSIHVSLLLVVFLTPQLVDQSDHGCFIIKEQGPNEESLTVSACICIAAWEIENQKYAMLWKMVSSNVCTL